MPGDNPHHFDFDLDRGIRSQVVETLESSPLFTLEKGLGPQANGGLQFVSSLAAGEGFSYYLTPPICIRLQ